MLAGWGCRQVVVTKALGQFVHFAVRRLCLLRQQILCFPDGSKPVKPKFIKGVKQMYLKDASKDLFCDVR